MSRSPVLSLREERELARLYGTGKFAIAELAQRFNVSHETVRRRLHESDISVRAQGEKITFSYAFKLES